MAVINDRILAPPIYIPTNLALVIENEASRVALSAKDNKVEL